MNTTDIFNYLLHMIMKENPFNLTTINKFKIRSKFGCNKLNDVKRRYSVYDKEFYAIVQALKK